MRWTRLSFFYLIGYLAAGGIGFLTTPRLALELMFSTRTYDDAMMRLAGALMIALATIVFQITRLRIEQLYSTTLVVRAFLISMMAALYVDTGDRMFLVFVGIVGLGMLLTALGFIRDRRTKTKSRS